MKTALLALLLVANSSYANVLYCFNEVAESSELAIQNAIQAKLKIGEAAPLDMIIQSVTYKGFDGGNGVYSVKGNFYELVPGAELGSAPKSLRVFSADVRMGDYGATVERCGNLKDVKIQRLVELPVQK